VALVCVHASPIDESNYDVGEPEEGYKSMLAKAYRQEASHVSQLTGAHGSEESEVLEFETHQGHNETRPGNSALHMNVGFLNTPAMMGGSNGDCPDQALFTAIKYGVSGYDLLLGDIFGDQDPGFRRTIFKASRENQNGCPVLETGITVTSRSQCKGHMDSYAYDSVSGFIKGGQEAYSSGKGFQWGMDLTIRAEVPGIPISAEGSIPPMFTSASGNSNAVKDMKQFFQSEAGYGVTAHAECGIYNMMLSTISLPPFDETFGMAVKMLDAATHMSANHQRELFLAFLNDYGTHYVREIELGAKVAYTQKYSQYTSSNVERTVLQKCTTKKSGFLFGIFKKSTESCTAQDETKIKYYGGSNYDATIITRGSRPTAEGSSWFDQEFIPEPIKYEISPIVNLFTDMSISSQKIFSSSPVNASALRHVYAPLYYNYCGPQCACFIQNCVQCSPTGHACEMCTSGYRYYDGACRRMMHIIGLDFTYSLSLDSPDSLVYRSKTKNGFKGCRECAYAMHEGSMYLAGGMDESGVYSLTTSVVHPDGSGSQLPSLPTSAYSGELSFVLNGRQYVTNPAGNGVWSRSLAYTSNPNVQIDDWSAGPFPGMVNTARSAVIYKDAAYITGGYIHDNLKDTGRKDLVWAVQETGPGTLRWGDVLPRMKDGRDHHCNVLVDDSIFVLGGDPKTVEVYNIQRRTWSLRASQLPENLLSLAFLYPSCATFGTDIYVRHLWYVYRYNTVDDVWSTVTSDLPYEHATAMFIVQ